MAEILETLVGLFGALIDLFASLFDLADDSKKHN